MKLHSMQSFEFDFFIKHNGFVMDVVYINIFSFIIEYCFLICIYHKLFSYSFRDGHLDCF
jgi:hypothetical protein